jgi:SNF2 family DNA or RNA helicase
MTFHPRSRLRDKQRIIRNEIVENPAKLIISLMGSGKTASTLHALRDLLDSFTVRHVLIVAPLRVATDVWPQEIEAWKETRLMRYSVACGSPEARAAAADARTEITIINRENLVWLAKHIRTIQNWYWDMVVIDESSMFKDGSKRTKRSKVKKRSKVWHIIGPDGEEQSELTFDTEKEAQDYVEFEGLVLGLLDNPTEAVVKEKTKIETKVRKGGNMTRFGVLSTARQKIDRVIELTGTPRPNSWEDMWGQMYLLDQGAALGRTKTDFLKRFFDHNKYTHENTIKDGAADEIMRRVDHLVTSLPADKLVPEPIYIPVNVTLPPKVMEEYRRFEQTLVSEAYDVEAVSKGVLANKLLQLSNGGVYKEDGSVVEVHREKLKALDDLLEEAEGENVLLFYGFKFDLDLLKQRYPDAVVLNESATAVEDWNAGKIKLLLAHPASCAHGLNMQYGGHICVWYGFTWSLELWLQANARLPRPGQKHQVAIYMLVAKGTYDEKAVEVLNDKNTDQQAMIDSVTHWMFRT